LPRFQIVFTSFSHSNFPQSIVIFRQYRKPIVSRFFLEVSSILARKHSRAEIAAFRWTASKECHIGRQGELREQLLALVKQQPGNLLLQ
jgi:hypothetical protein